MPLAATPPAEVKKPPTTTSPLGITASVEPRVPIAEPRPVPSSCQVLPFHFATPPGNEPAAITSWLGNTDNAKTVCVIAVPAPVDNANHDEPFQ